LNGTCVFLRMAERHTLANLVENGCHSVIAQLAEHHRQRHGGEAVTAETERGDENTASHTSSRRTRIALADHGRQLVEITHQHDLHAAKRRPRMRPEAR
jgi:hypothetical protein